MKDRFQILVVGGGIAGFSAALKASEYCDSVGIISEERRIYRRAALNSIVYGSITREEEIEIFPKKEAQERGVKVYHHSKAQSIKPSDNLVVVATPKGRRKIQYSKLIIATGSIPSTPQIDGANSKDVFCIKWFNDSQALSLRAKRGKKVVVVGAGLVGLETAEALAHRGLKVTLIEKCPSILPQILEEDLAKKVTKHVRSKGIEVLLNRAVCSVSGRGKVRHIVVNGEEIKTDLVVFATGFRPNTSILKYSGIRLNHAMAVETSKHMGTNLQGVYAAGDCAESLDLVSGCPVYRPLGTVAARAGEIAGLNAADKSYSYKGFLRRQYDHVFGVDIVSMGLTKSFATNLGMKIHDISLFEKRLTEKDVALSRPLKNLIIKGIIDKTTNSFIGFQAVGVTKYHSWYSLFFQECITKKYGIDALSLMGLRIE